MIRAELDRVVEFPLVAGSDDDLASEVFGDGERGGGDPAADACDEDGLSGTQVRFGDHHGVRGECAESERRGVDGVGVVVDRREVVCGAREHLRVGAVVVLSDQFIVWAHRRSGWVVGAHAIGDNDRGVIDDAFANPAFVDPFSDADDLAAAVTSGDSWVIEFESWDAFPDPEVHMIERGAEGLDDHLTRRGAGGIWPVRVEGDVRGDGAGLFLDDDGFHSGV